MISNRLLPIAEVLGLLTPALPLSSTDDVKVEITLVPACGAGSDTKGNIAGKVTGLQSYKEYKIVLYALGDKWYVQPLSAGKGSDTKLGADGKWSNWTHLGYRYAALLVPSSFTPDAEALNVPSEGVVASAEEPCKN